MCINEPMRSLDDFNQAYMYVKKQTQDKSFERQNNIFLDTNDDQAITLSRLYHMSALLAEGLLRVKSPPLNSMSNLKLTLERIKEIIPEFKHDKRLYYTLIALENIIEGVLDEDFMALMGDFVVPDDFNVVEYGKGVEKAKKDMNGF